MKRILFILSIIFLANVMYAQIEPSFPGGETAIDKYLKENIRYPQIAIENGVEGVVVVGFMVMTDGSLQDIRIMKFVDPDLEKEAIRLVEGMPAWTPAEKDGAAIEAPAKVNVPFILE